MSANEDKSDPPRQDLIEDLIEYEETIIDNAEEIERAIEANLTGEKRTNNFDQFGDSVSAIIGPTVDNDEDINTIINSIFNALPQFNNEMAESLNESGASDELLKYLRSWRVQYGIEVNQRLNRFLKGQDWWSNIKTDVGVRSSQSHYHNELIIDYSDVVTFGSDTSGMLTLAHHFLSQVWNAQNQIGDDILRGINRERLENIEDRVNTLIEEVDEMAEDEETSDELDVSEE